MPSPRKNEGSCPSACSSGPGARRLRARPVLTPALMLPRELEMDRGSGPENSRSEVLGPLVRRLEPSSGNALLEIGVSLAWSSFPLPAFL